MAPDSTPDTLTRMLPHRPVPVNPDYHSVCMGALVMCENERAHVRALVRWEDAEEEFSAPMDASRRTLVWAGQDPGQMQCGAGGVSTRVMSGYDRVGEPA